MVPVLEDEDAGALQSAGASPGSQSLRYLDPTDEEAVASRMAEADIAIGALAPGYRHEETLARAALRAGTSYLSSCPDAPGTAVLMDLADEAGRAGVILMGGLSWTPGLSILLALAAARRENRPIL
ncbi:MAG: hypothetical protein CVT84_16690, partial [Alphaproteobacteria bacterium HGW-Alphaproteobacteria-6]